MPGRAAAALFLILALVVTGCSDDASIPPPSAPVPLATTDRVADALATIGLLEGALRGADADAASALGSGAAQEVLAQAAGNVRRLGLVEVSLRYVTALSSTTVAGTEEFGPESWQATVAVEYRLRDWDKEPTRLETTFTFAPGDTGQAVLAIGSDQGRTPLWLAGSVKPVVAGRTLVLERDGNGKTASRLARRAVRDVGRVLPDWNGRLVIESPANEAEFDRVLGTSQEQYANIAAVTASVDGSTGGGSPLHVFLNPALFDALGPKAAQIVISHESTHVATEAPYTENMPTWLLEGFADYVALVNSGIGVRTAAAQIIARLRSDGLPDDLPSNEDLAPTASGLGATYEEAWLVNRFLANKYGEPKLIRFYYAIDGGQSVDRAFQSVLRTSQRQFVASWRADLRSLLADVAD